MSELNNLQHEPVGFWRRMGQAAHNNLLTTLSGLALIIFVAWAAHQDYSTLFSNRGAMITGAVIFAIFLHVIGFSLIVGLFRKLAKSGVAHSHSHDGVELETRGDKFRIAGIYDGMVQLLTLGRETKMRDAIIDLVELNPGDAVLDVGCGTGTLLMTAERRLGSVGRFAGTDAAHEMTTKAQQKADKAGLKATFRPGLIEKIEFGDGEFDVTLNSLVMHHLPDEEKAQGISEMYRVLKPNGQILIVDIEASEGGRLQGIMDFVVHSHGGPERAKNTMQALLPFLQNAGFEEIELGKVNRQLGYVKARKIA